MGNRSAKGEIKFKHFYFDEVYKRESYGKELITITRPIMSEAQYIGWHNIYSQAQDMTKDALFLPEQVQYRKIKGGGANCCCAADSEVEMTFQNFDYLLHSELINRGCRAAGRGSGGNAKTYFKETELCFIFYKLLEGGKEFQIRSKSVGDIRPKNILYTKSGDIKMINLASFPWQKTAIDKILDSYDNKTIFFLAPQQSRFLGTTSTGRGKYPNPKTEAFSISLTLLQIATLQPSQNLYTMPSRTLNRAEVQNRLQNVKQRYPTFHRYLEKGLEEQEGRRMSNGEIWACLKCHSEKITELESFIPNQARQDDAVQRFYRQASIH